MQENKHTVIIEQRKLITVSGVESVNSFSEVRIVLTRIGGEKMSVVGTDLKITNFSKSTGAFTAEGSITSVQYGGKGIAARIFK